MEYVASKKLFLNHFTHIAIFMDIWAYFYEKAKNMTISIYLVFHLIHVTRTCQKLIRRLLNLFLVLENACDKTVKLHGLAINIGKGQNYFFGI